MGTDYDPLSRGFVPPTEETRVDVTLRSVAREHSVTCNSIVAFTLGEGWLCSRCDDDFSTFEWNGSPELYVVGDIVKV